MKANAVNILRQLADRREPIVIALNGEAKAVLQDIVSCEQTQETLALLKILALGDRQIEQDRIARLCHFVKPLRQTSRRAWRSSPPTPS